MKRVPLFNKHGEMVAHAKVDDLDFRDISQHRWWISRCRDKVYAAARVDGRHIVRLHRFLVGKPGLKVDHRNGDGLDNRRSNLRACTNSQNLQNRGRNANNTSGYKGVYLVPAGQNRVKTPKWAAGITVGGRSIKLGRFLKKKDAARAYNRAARKYFGQFAILNPV